MERFEDNGIVISTKTFGERKVIVTLLTENHGLCAGMFRYSKTTKAICEPGSLVYCKWQARLADHLGTWTLEQQFSPLSILFTNPEALMIVNASCSMVKAILPEREPASAVYHCFAGLIHQLPEKNAKNDLETNHELVACLISYCYLELFLLSSFALTLDVSKCAATGTTTDLIYISPKTGRAVCRAAGYEYRDKLLPLPGFFLTSPMKPLGKSQVEKEGIRDNFDALESHVMKDTPLEEILAALSVSGYFLTKYGFTVHDRDMPKARLLLYEHCQKMTNTESDQQKR